MNAPLPRPPSRFFLAGSAVFVVLAIGLIILDYRRLVPWLLFLVSLSNFMTVFLLRRSRRSPSSSQAYLWSDAWLLQAVAVASQTQACDLADVLQAADGIQHTAMSPAELHGGLVRLTAGGLLIETDGRFALTSSVPQDVRNQLTAGFAIGRPVAQSFLRSEPWDRSRNAHDSRNDGLQYPGLTPERFRKAEKEFPRAT